MKQKLELIGRLGKDAELKTTNSGVEFMIFSIPANDGYKDKKTGEWVDEVEWFNCIAWNGLTKLFKHMTKGSMIALDGKIKSNFYDNKKGVKMKDYNVVVTSITLLDVKKKQGETETAKAFDDVDSSDDLPF